MEFLGCIGLIVLVWVFAAPIMCLIMWQRIAALEQRLTQLSERATRHQSLPVQTLERHVLPSTKSAANLVEDVVLPREQQPVEIAESDFGPDRKHASAPSVQDVQPTLVDWVPLVVSTESPSRESIDQAEMPTTDPLFELRNAPPEPSVEPHAVADQPDGPPPGSSDRPSTSTQELAMAADQMPSRVSIEEILGGKWLAYVGAVAVMIGAGFGLKYAIDNQWLGPAGRVTLGVMTGLISFAGGAFAMRKEYRFLGQALTGAALGVLYLSFFAAFHWYHLVPYELAFAGMVVTTIGGLAFSHAFDSQPTAVLGMIGGFLTPAMLPPATGSAWELFPYLLLLDIGVLGVSSLRRWTGLQVMVFFGTIFTWLIWYDNYYSREDLLLTLGFLTTFFALFAALSVIHNIVQKRVAEAADFFLMLATPVVYFATLYWLTYEIWPYEQGIFALGLMAVYTWMAIFAAGLNPAGKSVIAALSGLAATFLVLAPPLSLTGHWVTVAWIAQSILLVELGLRFELKSLKWTGLSLLAKVQCILVIYAIGTLVDPIDFQTAFVRQKLHLIAAHHEAALAWTNIFNNRSYSYLIDMFGMGLLAWEYRRRTQSNIADDGIGPRQRDIELALASSVPVVGLLLGLLEIFVWGVMRHWHVTAILSACSIWTSIVASVVVGWSLRVGPRGIERMAWLFFGILAVFLGIDAIWTHFGLESSVQDREQIAFPLWLLNSRGLAFFSAMAALTFTAVMHHLQQRSGDDSGLSVDSERAGPIIRLDRLFGCLAYWVGLIMVLLETYVWGFSHHWPPGNILSAMAFWMSAFALGLVLWETKWLQFPWRFHRTNNPGGVTLSSTDTADSSSQKKSMEMVYAIFQLLGAIQVINACVTITALEKPSNEEGAMWLLNVRGLSLLAAVIVTTISARLFQRSPLAKQSAISLQLGSASFLAGLTTVLLETLVWGVVHHWRPGTILSASSMWTAAFSAGLIGWRVRWGSRTLDNLVIFSFQLLGAFLLFNSIGSFAHAGYLRQTQLDPINELWLLNPRGFGFLLSVGVATFAAVLYQSLGAECDVPNGHSKTAWDAERLATRFAVVALLGGLILVLLETAVWGMPRGWRFGTLISCSAMWTSIFAGCLAIWVAPGKSRELDRLVIGVFVVLGAMIVVAGIVPFEKGLNSNFRGETSVESEWWFLNPRGLGYLLGIAATGLAASTYRRIELQTLPKGTGDDLTLSQILGVSAYLAGLALITTEAISQGTIRHWLTGTSLAVTIAWTLYATGTLIAGIYWRAATVRVLALLLLVLTIGKVFLIDIWHLETVIRVFAFLSLGAALMLVSFLYRRFRDRIRAWVIPIE
jgi:hypothetical protein